MLLRSIIVLLVVMLLSLQYRLWAGDNGSIPEVRLLSLQVSEIQAEGQQLKERNEALAAEVDDLRKGSEAIEERARNDLGMVKEGETFFHVLSDESAEPLKNDTTNP